MQNGSALGACLCAVSAVLLVFAVESAARPILGFAIYGMLLHLTAFYWIPLTITSFGGFPPPASWALFVLYAAISTIQFVLCGWMFVALERGIAKGTALALPAAWFLAEWAVPRLFPWYLAHFLLPWRTYSGLAEFIGIAPLSALLLWWSSVIVGALSGKRRLTRGTVFGLIASVGVLGASSFHNAQLEKLITAAPAVRTALIQGNLDAKEKGNVRYFAANLARYRDLTREARRAGAEFIVWPESVVTTWIPEDLPNVRGTKADPDPELDTPLLYGGLSFRKRSPEEQREILGENPDPMIVQQKTPLLYHSFNSGIGIDERGAIVGRYHKKILMPFGEYLPLADRFPWIKEISPQTGDFTAGDLSEPIAFSLSGERQLRVGTLICYEDLMTSLVRSAVARRANVLINLTNDAWYGDTAAPRQHHILASWRAIEARRYLLRSTNTGHTAVVDPFGQTVASLPGFAPGTLVQEIRLLDEAPSGVRWGDLAGLVFGVLVVGMLVTSAMKSAKKPLQS